MKKLTEPQKRILTRYCSFAERKMAHPSLADMYMMGITRRQIRTNFGTYGELRKQAMAEQPKSFANIATETLFTKKIFEVLQSEADKFKRYFVTTTVLGAKVFEPFYESIMSYGKKRDSLTLCLTSSDPAASAAHGKKVNPEKWFEQLTKSHRGLKIAFEDMGLNDNVFLSSIKLSAKQLDPITSLGRIGQRNGSFLFASPKQRLKMVPTSNTQMPHAIMTTGAVTLPAYKTERYMSQRLASIADYDHVLGGVIVEVVDSKMFHFRQVQADRQGSFIDLGVRYKADGNTERVQPEALSLGDWHSGETDPAAREAFVGRGEDSVIMVTKPRRLIVHDGFNGMSISHHEQKNKILRAQRSAAQKLSLEKELIQYGEDLDYLASFPFVEEVVIVKSNHDLFLDRYLSEARYVEDPQNYALSLRLSADMIEGKSPLQAFVDSMNIKNAGKLRWLSEDDDYKIAGVELGAHGHLGANGAKGSLHAMEAAYGNSISGHAHSQEILRGAWQNGTMSIMKPSYVRGPSSWTFSSTLLYPNGSRQLISVIAGEWRLTD